MAYVPRLFSISYSIKNIPLVSKFQYQKQLTYRIEDLIRRMRWKLYWWKQKGKGYEKETYGFNTMTKAPFAPELKEFENDLIGLVASVEMRTVTNELQSKMRRDLEEIRRMETEVIVASDKTANFYCIPVEKYMSYLGKEIRRDYRRVDEDVVEDINREAAIIANRLDLDDRIEGMALKQSFISIKDHKETFPAKLDFRLISPAKTNIGRVSKRILDRVNSEVREKTGLNQWKSTKEVVKWFKGLQEKNSYVWLKFNIQSFYPSITKDLLLRTLDFLQTYTPIRCYCSLPEKCDCRSIWKFMAKD